MTLKELFDRVTQLQVAFNHGELTAVEWETLTNANEREFLKDNNKVTVQADHPTFRRIDDYVNAGELQDYVKELERLGYENIQLKDCT